LPAPPLIVSLPLPPLPRTGSEPGTLPVTVTWSLPSPASTRMKLRDPGAASQRAVCPSTIVQPDPARVSTPTGSVTTKASE
jgi:hypothetical protein